MGRTVFFTTPKRLIPAQQPSRRTTLRCKFFTGLFSMAKIFDQQKRKHIFSLRNLRPGRSPHTDFDPLWRLGLPSSVFHLPLNANDLRQKTTTCNTHCVLGIICLSPFSSGSTSPRWRYHTVFDLPIYWFSVKIYGQLTGQKRAEYVMVLCNPDCESLTEKSQGSLSYRPLENENTYLRRLLLPGLFYSPGSSGGHAVS